MGKLFRNEASNNNEYLILFKLTRKVKRALNKNTLWSSDKLRLYYLKLKRS